VGGFDGKVVGWHGLGVSRLVFHQTIHYSQQRMTFDREKLKQSVADLANQGVFIGTSSWKYPLCRSRHKGYFAEYRIMPSAWDTWLGF
jgi:hypothetical protein